MTIHNYKLRFTQNIDHKYTSFLSIYYVIKCWYTWSCGNTRCWYILKVRSEWIHIRTGRNLLELDSHHKPCQHSTTLQKWRSVNITKQHYKQYYIMWNSKLFHWIIKEQNIFSIFLLMNVNKKTMLVYNSVKQAKSLVLCQSQNHICDPNTRHNLK